MKQASDTKGAIEVYINGGIVDDASGVGEKPNGLALKYADLEAYVLARAEAIATERERKAFEAAEKLAVKPDINSTTKFEPFVYLKDLQQLLKGNP